MGFVGLAAVFILLALAVACRCAERGFRPFKSLKKHVDGLTAFQKFAAAIAVSLLIAYGGTKTNDPPRSVQAPAPAVLTDAQLAAGFALVDVSTNDLPSSTFNPRSSDTVHRRWVLRGAFEDRFTLAPEGWRMQVGSNVADRIRLHAGGRAEACATGGTVVAVGQFWPFDAPLGIAPEANWHLMGNGEGGTGNSMFWHGTTPSNTLLLTWQNALLNRDTNTPVSVQAELWPDGRFTYRYDLSRRGVGAGTTGVPPVGASLSGHAWTTNGLPTNVTSLAFWPLDPSDTATGDRDGDGISTAEELFVRGTDPGLWDTDGDGVSDGDEIALGTDPLVRGSDEVTGGTASPDFLSECGTAADRLVAWEIVPSAFSFACPAGHTNVVVRTFAVNRTSPWQQLYVSSRANGAMGWSASDVSIRYVVDGGATTNEVPSVSADSWRVPLGPGPVTNVTFVVAATGGAPALSRPLHLVRWSPRVTLCADEAGKFLPVPEGKAPVFLSRRRAESGWYVVPFSASFAGVPHLGGVDAAAAAELALPPCAGLAVTNAPTRAFLASDPVWAELPPEGTNAATRVCCWEMDHETPGEIGSGPRASRFDAPWPLSTPALRKSFHRALGIEAGSSPVMVRILPSHPLVGLRAQGSPPLRGQAGSTNEPPGEVELVPPDAAVPEFDGTPDPDDSCAIDADNPDEGSETTPGEEDDGCGEEGEEDCCDCAEGDGTRQCSFRLRISLGSPTPGESAGFVWAALEEPAAITPAVFNVLGTDEVASTTNAAGEFTVVCSAPGGRTVQVTNIEHGVALTVWNASGRLENRWEVTNPWNAQDYVRCRKLTILGNAVSDETFNLDDGMACDTAGPEGSRVAGVFPDEGVTRTDELRGVSTTKRKWRTDPDEPGFVTDVCDETVLEDWTVVSSVMSEYVKIGAGSTSRRRLARRYGHDRDGYFDERTDYWCDPANRYRHARRKSVRSNRRPWSFHDYDAQGRETVAVEQLDGSPFPDGLAEVSHLAELPEGCSAKATVTSYEPASGDSRDRNDSFLPRRRDTWIMRGGEPPVLVGTETWLYTRSAGAHGVALRACVHSAGVGETRRSETTVAYPEDYDVPKELRGRTVSHTGFDGVTETSQIEKGTWDAATRTFSPVAGGAFVRTTTLRAGGGTEDDTFAVEVEDSLRRLKVFAATGLTETDTLVGHSSSTYDDIDRLRSTSYSDGTSETNAYSCCRLLWRSDRQDRKTLRSARTGTDDLYHAEEDIWLAEVGNGEGGTGNGLANGFRVTQHFCDGLGRETNTVTYAGTIPGEAAVSIGEAALLPLQRTGGTQLVASVTTSYPYGLSDYSVRTDERGAVTTTVRSSYEDRDETTETTITNDTSVLVTTTTRRRNGGSSVRREWYDADGSFTWTEETRSTDWRADGRRVDTVSTKASDHPAVSWDRMSITNSVTVYDLFGRVESVTVHGANGSFLVTSNFYDGVSDRILTSTRYAPTLPPRVTAYLYNALGEQLGYVLDGITNRTDVTYEQISNEWWKVETTTVVGPSTNSLTIVRTQLTGLSDACRRHTVTLTGTAAILAAHGTGVLPVDGSLTETLVTYDPSTGIETETVTSSVAPTVIRRYLHGVLLSTEATGETTYSVYDAFARVAQTWRAAILAATGTTGTLPVASYDYAPTGDLLATHTYTNATDYTTETYAYDMLGNRIATTDALGNTTYRTYDPLGHLTVEWGATYPVRYTYDTQGRRTSLTTFRTTGGTQFIASAALGDTTTWTYDPYTGNCLSKTYADGSTIIYTYTPDNLLLRTTYASGKWKENVYESQRRLCGVIYSSPDMDYELQLDAYGRTVWESNSVCSISYALVDAGTATNELVSVADETISIARALDVQDRLAGLTMPDSGYEVNYVYVGDGNIENISNNLVCVSYLYSSNRLDVGYSIRLANGTTILRNLYRDEYRRSLVTNITTVVNGNNVEGLAYSFDAASRPITRNGDTFGYNARSEVVVATIGGNSETHEYDNIGNSTRATFNAVTNMFVANNLNQYTAINRNTVPLWETSHDIDGNMTQCGDWTYTYDTGHQLKYVSSNGVLLVTNYYDAKSRRVRKVTPKATMTFFYDEWNLIEEQVDYTNGTTSTIHYYWGKDLSGTFQGAGGVGGLLYLTVDGAIYIPCYDNIGNVTRYLDANGNTVAQYTYDAFGNTISKSGPLADFFRHCFSTKYYDAETGLYYYGYRFYHPILMRWLNRDPLEEDEGENLYAICENNPVNAYDELGLWTATAESSGQCRRVYKFEEGDTMKSLAKKVGLDPNEYQKWGRVEKSVKAEKKTSVSVSSNTNPGCYVSVPNVWVEADLLRGGNAWNRVVNIGGTVGSFFGTTLGRYGYQFEHPHTMNDFLMAISGSGKDLYGLTVYAHGVVNKVGEPTGEFGGPKGPFVSQSVLLGMIHGNGYKIAEANMMQCYSWAKIKRNGGTVDFEKKWREVAVKPFGYVGINALGIDFGGRK